MLANGKMICKMDMVKKNFQMEKYNKVYFKMVFMLVLEKNKKFHHCYKTKNLILIH